MVRCGREKAYSRRADTPGLIEAAQVSIAHEAGQAVCRVRKAGSRRVTVTMPETPDSAAGAPAADARFQAPLPQHARLRLAVAGEWRRVRRKRREDLAGAVHLPGQRHRLEYDHVRSGRGDQAQVSYARADLPNDIDMDVLNQLFFHRGVVNVDAVGQELIVESDREHRR